MKRNCLELVQSYRDSCEFTFIMTMFCESWEWLYYWNYTDLFLYWNILDLQESALNFRYSVAHERDGIVQKWNAEEDMEPFRTVVIFPADKLPVVIEKIKQELTKTWIKLGIDHTVCVFFCWQYILFTSDKREIRKSSLSGSICKST